MNRRELAVCIKQQFKDLQIPVKTITKILQVAENIIRDEVFNNHRVSLLGFGTFFRRHSKSYTKQTKLLGQMRTIDVPAKDKLSFIPSKRRSVKEPEPAE